ncbi:aspartate carbamoyltransferase [Methylomonas koyamae]|nr:aspartate carbamoyltransferase [Methylomonas koyamae]
MQGKPLAAVLPYPADQTEYAFTKTVHGGVQHVVTKSANDAKLVNLIQAHLRKTTEQFRKGDFSMTERMHGANMPGLSQLKTAKPDDIKIEYRALENGGQIHYSTEYPQYVSALHEWFDAQAREHDNSDLPGHQQHHLSPAE